MPTLRTSRNRRGWCPAFRANIRRFPLGAGIANAGALPCQEASRNAPTHVAGRDGLLVRRFVGDPECASFVAALCMDWPNGRSTHHRLAGQFHVFLRLAGTGCSCLFARPRHATGAGWRRFFAVKLRDLSNSEHEKQKTKRSGEGNQDRPVVGMGVGGHPLRDRSVVLQFRDCSSTARSASMGEAAARHFSRRVCRGLLPSDWIREPRLQTARNEPYTLDAGCDPRSQPIGHPSLLRSTATTGARLPPMWERSPGGIQFLPSLQPQTRTDLSAVPADRERD